jgi:hypothetical protein
MARNRTGRNVKVKSSNQVFPAPLAAILVMVAVLSLSYLWLCGQTESAGRRIKSLEKQRSEVRRRRFNEEYKWHGMKSQENLERALAMHGLEMTWPEKRRAVHISMNATRFDDRAEYVLAQNRRESKMRVAMR